MDTQLKKRKKRECSFCFYTGFVASSVNYSPEWDSITYVDISGRTKQFDTMFTWQAKGLLLGLGWPSKATKRFWSEVDIWGKQFEALLVDGCGVLGEGSGYWTTPVVEMITLEIPDLWVCLASVKASFVKMLIPHKLRSVDLVELVVISYWETQSSTQWKHFIDLNFSKMASFFRFPSYNRYLLGLSRLNQFR